MSRKIVIYESDGETIWEELTQREDAIWVTDGGEQVLDEIVGAYVQNSVDSLTLEEAIKR